MQKWAPQIANWMRSNAPWTDRTSNARQGLYADVEPPTFQQVTDIIELFMAHSVYYGYYLEGWNPETNSRMIRPGSQQWKIIEPALDHFGPLIWGDVRRLFT